MLYLMHEWQRSMLSPLTYWAEASAKMFGDVASPFARMPGADRAAAGYELMFRLGKAYEKPEFDIHSVHAHGHDVAIVEQVALAKPFCTLKRFKRFSDDQSTVDKMKNDPAVLVVAPLSGHHSTLLRDTVRTLLRDHKVYITDWVDARMIPLDEGSFSLADYVAYVEEFIRHVGVHRAHVVSVCQPTVPVLAAVSLMAARGEATPATLTLMGGPIDTRKSPTSVDNLATTRPLSWFRNQLIHKVPYQYPGAGREVYPGFLQHAGFLAMNPSRHVMSHWDFYENLRKGDLDDAEQHRKFYDEYNAVLDMPAEYYLDTIETVFQEHRLPKGTWEIHGELVQPAKIKDTALLTIEGELDDISGPGQTEVAHSLCKGIAKKRKKHITVEGAGHYGIFSGRRWRDIVYPDVRDFIKAHDRGNSNTGAKGNRKV
ncbi:MAG: polyhydroxyalkanoate depolymerase [Luteibacter sp.]|uniref:polyhydroxyalkanoate depolymerase n=1 Tax=Rhodanobacteraceae TaxID=1775411 RepID=UPI00068F45CD|nr:MULTISPECIES: polyhydroxyalkanoate depolymerase [Rhodanobacteraceae]MDQ7997470.1 polyhydroxyalkanoate depolymerase [Luteibacter sp.]MDR6643070.1 poly(3-hydroxybutyrate) depolymerase [Luteibacter sp. 1214]SDF92069.1 poly(3-hydroxybutyrate) depolymerase [Dyella sp. 333MFSha]SKB93856.1 poly(3-hydroxybutyrate) depolymerase [Luteibacter sp. 22Crub2.1]